MQSQTVIGSYVSLFTVKSKMHAGGNSVGQVVNQVKIPSNAHAYHFFEYKKIAMHSSKIPFCF